MSTLTDLIHGKGVHIDPLAAVDDLPWELAGRRVLHIPNTIWKLLGHLNYWMDYGLKSIEGAPPPRPASIAETWPGADGPTDDVSWRHEVALFRTNLAQLATLADARASTLSRIVNKKSGKTVEGVLWELALHNSYHCGQIVQLRHALGAWPPAGGAPEW
ncbi:MAG: DinB family protein [Gemmatimonadetes bacterium]|nr:DinB family protein [Gemmatimonadota bacterium]